LYGPFFGPAIGELQKIMEYRIHSWKSYKFDVWHNGLHYGVCHTVVASTAVIFMTDIAPGSKVQDKLDFLDGNLQEYLSENKVRLSFFKLTREKLGYESFASYPCGNWQKGSDSIILMKWLEALLSSPRYKLSVDAHAVLPIASKAVAKFNCLMSSLYGEDYFIAKEMAMRLGTIGVGFIQDVSELAARCHNLGWNRYLLQPKVHALDHSWRFLLQQGLEIGLAINPLAEAVPMCEDFIGKVSRLSRRVSPRLVMLRSIQSYLIKLRQVWSGST
jgi:hypothetical protein